MRANIACAGVLAFCLSASMGAAAAPLEAYGTLPQLGDFAVSPDGGKLVYTTQLGQDRDIVVQDVHTGKLVAAVKTNGQKLRDLSWDGPDHVLIVTSTTASVPFVLWSHDEQYLIQSLDVPTRTVTPLLNNFEDAMNVIIDSPQPRMVDGAPVVFLETFYFASDMGYPALFSVDLQTGRTKLVRQGGRHSGSWFVDAAGTPLAETQYDDKSQQWTLKLHRDDNWSEAMNVTAPIDVPSLYGLSADGTSLLVDTTGENSERDLIPVSLATGTPGPSVEKDYGFDDPIENPDTLRIAGGLNKGMRDKYVFFDPKEQAAWDGIVQGFPGENVNLVSLSGDMKLMVIQVSGGADGDSFRLADLNQMRTFQIGAEYAGIGPADVAEVKIVEYKAGDGRMIPAYLTLPKGREPTKLPLVVFPHGGPAARDEPGFDWWAQAMAAQGYAVLQPQYRGSSGFGAELLRAGYGEFGRKMQTDLSDGVRALVAQGIADPARVCIVGASYGGYAALAGATLDPGVYRCAVSVAGMSDMRRFIESKITPGQDPDNDAVRYWERFVGAKNIDDPVLDAVSPAKHADTVTAPILLIHGHDDTVVPIAQSEEMRDALQKAGKTVQYVELPGEDHWLSRGETRLAMLKATVDFLKANDPPD